MPRRQPLSRGAAAVLAAGLLLAGCGGGAEPVAVDPPAPPPAAAAACARLRDALPAKVDEAEPRGTTPESALTAAWREPPVVMRCGVAKPKIPPAATLRTINDVDWFSANPDVTGPHVYTTVGRVANLELTIPDGRVPAGALVDLADPIKRALPLVR